MKTTMFDVLETMPQGVEDTNITSDEAVSADKVQTLVHQKLQEQAVPKKKTLPRKNGRKLTVMFVAAAIAVLVAGTLTVGALGGINTFIGEHSAGNMVNNLYAGGNVSLKTDPAYSGELLGITGDDTNVIGLVQLHRADGGDIVEPGKDSFIETNDYYQYYDNKSPLVEEQVYDYKTNAMRTAKVWHTKGHDLTDTTGKEFDNDADVKVSHFIPFRDAFDSPYPAFADYEMADSKTINCYYTSHIDSGLLRSLKGETMLANDRNLFIYQIDKVIYQAETQEAFVLFRMDFDQYNSVISEHIRSLRDDQVITEYRNRLVIASRKPVDIGLDLSVQLNYKSHTCSLTPAPAVYHGANDIDYTITHITAGSLTTDLELDFTVPEGQNAYEAFVTLFPTYTQSAKITLTNGRVIEGNMSINRNYWEHHTITLTYQDQEGKWLIVNPAEIESIEFQGKRITCS